MIGPDLDIPAPDLGTDEQVMAWMMDTYSMTQGKSVPGVVTGKPILVGGSAGRREATGRGIVYVLYQAAKSLGQALRGKAVVIQGFGNVGSVAARMLWNDGCTVAGVGDFRGAIWNPHGIDIRQLEAHVAESGSVAGFPGADPISNAELLEQPCDVLVPAVGGVALHREPQRQVRARGDEHAVQAQVERSDLDAVEGRRRDLGEHVHGRPRRRRRSRTNRSGLRSRRFRVRWCFRWCS